MIRPPCRELYSLATFSSAKPGHAVLPSGAAHNVADPLAGLRSRSMWTRVLGLTPSTCELRHVYSVLGPPVGPVGRNDDNVSRQVELSAAFTPVTTERDHIGSSASKAEVPIALRMRHLVG